MGYFPLIFFCSAIIFAMMANPLEKRLRLPFPAILIIIGFILAAIFSYSEINPRFDAFDLQHLSEYLFIPIILFSSAFYFGSNLLLREGIINFCYVLLISLITLILIAIALHYIFDSSKFSWATALLTGSILTATGIYAVTDYLSTLKIPKRIIGILQLESLFSGVIAVVFFKFFLGMELHPEQTSMGYWLLNFVMLVMGGLLIGIIAGWLCLWLLKFIKNPLQQNLLILSLFYLAYFLALLWEVSGGVAVFCFGIMLGNMGQLLITEENNFSRSLWDFLYLATLVAIFLLLGAYLKFSLVVNFGLPILTVIIIILMSRALSVYAATSIYHQTHKNKAYPTAEQNLLILGGIRAALPIALAFALPTQLVSVESIQNSIYGVVVFNLLIQTPILAVLWQKTHKKITSKRKK